MSNKDKKNFGTVLTFAAVFASGGALGPWAAANYAYFWGAAIAYGGYSARAQRKAAKNARNASLEDRKITLRGGTHSKGYVYGFAFVPTVLTFHRSAKDKTDPYLWLLFTLPIAHQIEGYNQIFFGNVPLLPASTNGDSAPGIFSRTFIKSHIVTGVVPADGLIPVAGAPGDENEDFILLGPLQGYSLVLAIRRQEPPTTTGEDTWQDVVEPEATAQLLAGNQRIIKINGATPGREFTLSYSYQFNRSYLKVWTGNGEPGGTLFSNLIQATINEPGDMRWTSSDKLRGIPWILLRLHVDPDIFPREVEPVSVLVKGMNQIEDVRRPGLVGWQRNSIAVARDYALLECNIQPYELDVALNISEMNVCDEEITQPNEDGVSEKHPRYECNIFLDTAAAPIENLGTLLTSCDGSASYSGGKLDIRAGHWIEPTLILSDMDLVSMPTFTLGPDSTEVFNGIRAEFINADKSMWPMDLTPAYRSDFYKSQDNGLEQLEEIQLPGTVGAVAAHRIAKQMLHRARNSLTIQATFSIRAMRLAPEHTIWLSLRSYGMDTKGFRVKKIRAVSLYEFDLVLQEDSPILYQYNYDEATWPDPTPNTNLPDPRIVPDITGINAETNNRVATFGPTGELQPQCRVFWNEVTDPLVLANGYIEVRHRRSQDPEFKMSPRLPPTAKEYRFGIRRNDVLEIQARAANSLVRGAWSKSFRKVADDTPTEYLVGNLLINADLKLQQPKPSQPTDYVYPGWTFYDPTVENGLKHAVYPSPYLPWLVGQAWSGESGYLFMGISSGYSGVITFSSNSIACVPGERLLGYIEGLSLASRSAVEIQFFTENDSLIYTAQSTFVPAIPIDYSVLPKIEDFKKMAVFSQVPVGARQVRMVVSVTYEVSNAVGPVLYWGHPYLGRASDGQEDLPPWLPGA